MSVKWEDLLQERARLFVEASSLLTTVGDVQLSSVDAILKDAERDLAKIQDIIGRLEDLADRSSESPDE